MCRQVCRKDVMERSEMESFRNACNRYVNILHSIGMRQHQLHFDGVIASRWDAYLFCYLCRHFASVMLHFASLISHNLRCIPAYTHQIPTGFFSIVPKECMSLVEGRLWSKILMLPRPTVSDARHYIRTCLQAALASELAWS